MCVRATLRRKIAHVCVGFGPVAHSCLTLFSALNLNNSRSTNAIAIGDDAGALDTVDVHYTLLGVLICITYGMVVQIPLRMLVVTRGLVIAATVAVHLQCRYQRCKDNKSGGWGAGSASVGAEGAGGGVDGNNGIDDAVFLGMLGCWMNMLVVAWCQDSWHTDTVVVHAQAQSRLGECERRPSSSSSFEQNALVICVEAICISWVINVI